MKVSSLQNRLADYLPAFVFIVCIMQPLLDVLSYFADKIGMPNIITLLIRMGLLCVIVLAAFLLEKKKKKYYVAASILLLHLICHIAACHSSGYSSVFNDIANMIRIYQMPVLALCFITFVKTDERVYGAILHGFVVSLAIIAAVEIISVVTNTNPYTYSNKSIGIIGWFYDASAQSAILSALAPVVAAFAVNKSGNKFLISALFVVAVFLVLYFYATYIAYIVLLMCGAGFAIVMLITDRRASYKPIALLLSAFVVFAALMPYSPMQRNQDLVAANEVKKQEKIDNLIAEYDKALENSGLDKELKFERLRGAYNEYLGGLVERFGLEKTVLRYNFSEDADDLCSVRKMKRNYCEMLMEEQGIGAFLFGVELDDLTFHGKIYDAENDLHGIFYLCGLSGLCMVLLFLLYFVVLAIKALITKFRKLFNVESMGWAIAFAGLMFHVYGTCGVLRRPSSSFYLSVVLAVAVYLISERKKGEVK